MALNYDENLITAFTALLEGPPPENRKKEQAVQDFMETHSELIPIVNRLGHHVHLEAVISKYPLAPELITDYLWITKQSDRWRIVLVELESPDKDIFTNNMDVPRPSAFFNSALDQVRGWKRFIADHKDEVLRRLEPLIVPENMRDNPIEFFYELIVGRSANKNASRDRKKYIVELEKESGIHIMSYDTIIDHYRNDHRYRKNILRTSGTRFAFKYMHEDPTFFHVLGPNVIDLSKADLDHLRNSGYEIDEWINGTRLSASSDGKLTERTYYEGLSDDSILKKVFLSRLSGGVKGAKFDK